jgi:hypothetical protein
VVREQAVAGAGIDGGLAARIGPTATPVITRHAPFAFGKSFERLGELRRSASSDRVVPCAQSPEAWSGRPLRFSAVRSGGPWPLGRRNGKPRLSPASVLLRPRLPTACRAVHAAREGETCWPHVFREAVGLARQRACRPVAYSQ